MFGLTFEKLLIIGVIAALLIGPDRLPYYAGQLGRFVRSMRDMANGAKDRMKQEMGPEFDDVDWKKLDPRQYDPRRIIREALTDDDPATGSRLSAPRDSAARSGQAAATAAARAGQAATLKPATRLASPAASAPGDAGENRDKDGQESVQEDSGPGEVHGQGPAPFDNEAT